MTTQKLSVAAVLAASSLVLTGCGGGSAAAADKLSSSDRSICEEQASDLKSTRLIAQSNSSTSMRVLSATDPAVTALIGWQNEAENDDLALLLAQAAEAAGAMNAEAQKDVRGTVVGTLAAAKIALAELEEFCKE